MVESIVDQLSPRDLPRVESPPIDLPKGLVLRCGQYHGELCTVLHEPESGMYVAFFGQVGRGTLKHGVRILRLRRG